MVVAGLSRRHGRYRRSTSYSDGRYQARKVDRLPHPDTVGYLVRRPHPNTGEDSPVAFALVEGLDTEVRSIGAFWVAPAARRDHIGKRFALNVIGRHPGPWTVTFQHENIVAAQFWRQVANAAFGPERWFEERRPVPGRPGVPPDQWIRTLR